MGISAEEQDRCGQLPNVKVHIQMNGEQLEEVSALMYVGAITVQRETLSETPE